jgi:hypothetical protein
MPAKKKREDKKKKKTDIKSSNRKKPPQNEKNGKTKEPIGTKKRYVWHRQKFGL